MRDLTPSAVPWRKSSRSGGAENCVELVHGMTYAGARDSKHPDATIGFGLAAFRAFIAEVKAGSVDRA